MKLSEELAKIFLKNHLFAEPSAESLLIIIYRFQHEELFHEFVVKFVKTSLSMFWASEKKKKPLAQIVPLLNPDNKKKASYKFKEMSQEDIIE